MIVGTTGALIGPTPYQHKAFGEFIAKLPVSRFVHGGTRGWDTLAHYCVRRAFPDICIEIHPSDIDVGATVWIPLGRCEIYPKLAPLERNGIIVGRIHGLIAVPHHDEEQRDTGTWATVRYARDIGCPVYIIKSYGAIVRDVDPVFA